MSDLFKIPPTQTPHGDVSAENAINIYDYLRQNKAKNDTTCYTEMGDEWGISMAHIKQLTDECNRLKKAAYELMAGPNRPEDADALKAALSSDMLNATYIGKVVDDLCIKDGNIESNNTWQDYADSIPVYVEPEPEE